MGRVRAGVRHVPGAGWWQWSDRVAVELHVAHRRAEVAEYVVALLRECDLVHGVSDEAGFQHQRGVLSGVAPGIVKKQENNDMV